ncbi:hypothetical protein ACWCXC_17155 [Streptomyces sp. NPDC001515]
MSVRYVVVCDRAGPHGVCAAQLHTGARSVDEATAAAERAGWEINGSPDYCPGHSRAPRPAPPPTPIRRGGPQP